MNYSDLNDFEINKLVAESHDFVTHHSTSKYVMVSMQSCEEPCGARIYDPCKNPSDAWPIIVDNEISLICQHCKWTATDMSGPAKYWNENPLRAAMIVYLMMKDAENEV